MNETKFEPGRSRVCVRSLTVPIEGLDADWPGVRVAHISDCHFRRWNRAFEDAQRMLLSLDYDLLVYTGDIGTMIRFWRRSARLAHRFFEPLAEHRPIYAVLGNHDNPALATEAGLPIRFLRNESIEWWHAGLSFELAGIEQTKFNPAGDLNAAITGPRPPTFSILLAHYPSTIFRLPPGRVDVMLSGHTHGGQMRLPKIGCIWPNDRIPRRLARGLHGVNGTYLHVSAGLGTSPPIPYRINCPAEIAILNVIRGSKCALGRSHPAYDKGTMAAFP